MSYLTDQCLSDPQRWTNIPLLVKIFKLIVNELSSVVEANANRANPADWSQGTYVVLFTTIVNMMTARCGVV